MKKLLCLLMAFALILGLMAGCGSSSADTADETTAASETEASETEEAAEAEEAEEPAESEEAEEAEEAAEPAAEDSAAEAEAPAEDEGYVIPGGTTEISMPLTEDDLTISFFMRFNPQVQDYVQDMSDNIFYAELEKLTGVSVEFQLYHPSIVEEQFNLQVASGDYADVYCEYGASYKGGLDGAIEDEILTDLSDYIEEYMPNYMSYVTASDEDNRMATTDSGAYAAVYCVYEPYEPAKTGPCIRWDWADEAGIDVETMCTYEDYEAYLSYAYETYGASAYLTESGAPSFNYLISGYGVSYSDDSIPLAQKDGEVFCTLEDDGMREYLEMISDWYARGWVYSDFYSVDTQMGGGADAGMVTAGETSMWWGEVSYISQYEEDSGVEGFKVAAIQDAVKEAGDETHFAQTNYSRIGTSSYITISTACDELETVLQWLDYRYTQDGYILGNYGIEGETFEYDENGEPQYTDMIVNNPDGMTTTLAQWRYLLQNTVCLTSVAAANQGATEYELEAPSIWMTNKDNAWSIPSGVALTTEESEEYNSIASDIETYVSTTVLEFITGTRSLDEYDAFVETVENMGLQDCIDIYQAALDRYLSK